MGYNAEPKNSRRFDVPLSQGKSTKQNRAKKRYQSLGNGTNRALIDAGIVVATTIAVTVLLLGISGQISDSTAGNLIARSAAPLPQLSLSAKPPPTAKPTHSPTPVTDVVAPNSTPDDKQLQATVEKKLGDDPTISLLGITITVKDGQVALIGAAPTDELKDQVEKLVRGIKGVRQIDNQIIVIGNP